MLSKPPQNMKQRLPSKGKNPPCFFNGSFIFYLIILFCVACSFRESFAQTSPLKKIQPAMWWVGMKNPELQILLYGDKISAWTVSFQYPGVTISGARKVS